MKNIKIPILLSVGISVLLALVLCLAQGSVPVKADSCKIDEFCTIAEGFTPPEAATIIHYVSTGARAYTRIANRVEELYVGEHHRFTVVANKRKSVKVTWASSKPAIATINKKTGELTALAAGTTTITLWDSVNKAKQTYELTIKAKPVLPEVPEEWYEVEDITAWTYENGQYCQIQGVRLVFKSEYRYLYEQCSMLRLPDEIDGKKVVGIRGDESKISVMHRPSFSEIGFGRLTALQCRSEMPFAYEDGIREYYYTNNPEWLINEGGQETEVMSVPESTKMICSAVFAKPEVGTVRIPMNVKIICNGEYDTSSYSGGIWYGENNRFVVDGNNTNYYSIFDVLFTYPFYNAAAPSKQISLNGGNYLYNAKGKRTLVVYPTKRQGSSYKVPDGVERIDTGAFEGAWYLKKVVLPDSVTEIGASAFAYMKKKVEIVIPAGVTVFEEDYYSGNGPFGYYDENLGCVNGAENIIIVTPKGSAAEKYAIEHGIKYRNME